MGIEQTGLFSKETKNLIINPRCDELDIQPKPNPILHKKAKSYQFTYTIKIWATNMPEKVQNETMWESIKTWTNQLPVEVTWLDGESDVNIHFVEGTKF